MKLIGNADMQEAYNHTICDMESSLGCPQCRAEKLIKGTKGCQSNYSKGQRLACYEVLCNKHECGYFPLNEV